MNYRRRLEAQSRRSAALGIAGEVVMARYFRLEASGDIWISPMSVDGRTDWIGDALVIDDPAIEVDTVCWHMIEYAGAAAQAA